MVKVTKDQMHLRGGTVCGMQMRMSSMAAAMKIENTGKATNNSGAGFGGLVSTT